MDVGWEGELEMKERGREGEAEKDEGGERKRET